MSGNSVRILVVEDNQKHISDAVEYVSRLENCNVDFATTLAGALLLLQANKYDGIISDVFSPVVDGANADSFVNALTLNKSAIELKTHIVFNTSGNHHGVKYGGFIWKTPTAIHNAFRGGFLTSGMIIESYPEASNTDLDFKQWQAAFRYLLLVHEILVQGYEIPNSIELGNGESDYVYSGFPYGDYGKQTSRYNKTENPFALSVFAKYNT
jgi:CheY-like chemotaxis protein